MPGPSTRPAAPAALSEISPADCLELLAEHHLGRLAVNVPGWPPLIRPVSYVFDPHSRSVVFGCIRGSKFHALARAQRAAFEIDGEDGEHGWSVIVIGPIEEVGSRSDIDRLDRSRIRPWVAEDSRHWLRIRATAISGRRIGPAE